MKKIELRTRSRSEFVDVTAQVQEAVRSMGLDDGLLCLWVPHTTAAVTINENADPDVMRDIRMEMDKVIPFDDGYRHGEGNSAAHIKSSLFGPSLTCIVEDGRIALGTWQGIYFCEFDGPRTRKLWIKAMG